jgi:signal transduction histidine kinase
MVRSRDRSRTPVSFRWKGINLQLLTIIFLPLTVILVAITFGSLSLHQQAMRTLVGERDERAARTAAKAIDNYLAYRWLALENLSWKALVAGDQDRSSIQTPLGNFQDDFEGGIAIFHPDGTIKAIEGELDFWHPFIASSISWLPPSHELEGVYPHLLPIKVQSSHRGKMVILSAWDAEDEIITAGAFLFETLVSANLESIYSSNTGTITLLVDGDRNLLFQTGNLYADRGLENHQGVSQALSGESGIEFLTKDGSEHVMAYSPVEIAGWALVIEEPWEAVTSPMLRTTSFVPLVLVPVLLLALLALWFAANQIVKPLQDLEEKAAQLSWGDYQAIEKPVGGVEEIHRLQRELIHLAHKVQFAQKSLHDYIGAITAGQEEERNRLSRELHDDTLQSLIALKQRVQLAQMNLDEEREVEQFTKIEAMTEETINNLRRLTRALRPVYLEDLGLVPALEMLTREVSQIAGFQVTLQCYGHERRLDSTTELSLYRIVQEALSNVARHAKADQTGVSIYFSPQEVRLEIKDHGIGFEVPKSPADFAPGGHFGLLGMYERAELIGAELSIQSSPEEGTCILIVLSKDQELTNHTHAAATSLETSPSSTRS